MFIDTHCHLVDPQFPDVDSVVNNFSVSGGLALITMGCNDKSSDVGRQIAEKHDCVYFATGFHPSDYELFNKESFENAKRLASHPKCVAVGEVGLDYHFEPFDKEKMTESFVNHIEFSSQVNLPLSIHSRDATMDMVNTLKDYKNKLNGGAVMHCFSGSKETAKILLDLGLYISFSGTLTFKNANKAIEVAKYVPEDRMLIETDSPCLAPHPLRGTRNEPKNVSIVLECLAGIRNTDVEVLSKKLIDNTLGLFKKIKI